MHEYFSLTQFKAKITNYVDESAKPEKEKHHLLAISAGSVVVSFLRMWPAIIAL